MCLIEIKSLNKTFGKNNSKTIALKDVNLKINKGELVAIVGTSGSGKSTLLNIIGALTSPSSGEYLLNSTNISNLTQKELAKVRNKTFGFIVQYFALITDYTVSENIEIPLEYSKVKASEREKIISDVLNKLGILDKARKKPKELSGGQQQRVAIARAIINNPDIILADEPTGALDSKTSQQVMDILKELNKEGKTIIIVTHDNKIAMQCDKILNIEDGCIKTQVNIFNQAQNISL